MDILFLSRIRRLFLVNRIVGENFFMKRMLINATQQEELRVALVDGQKLYDLDIESLQTNQKKANIYKGKITRVEPSLEAVFVDYGSARHGFLPFKEIAKEYLIGSTSVASGQPAFKDLIQVGQEILVQIDKEERGNKGAALTTYIALPGRFMVLMPNNPRAGGVSRRVQGEERRDLRDALDLLEAPDNMGLIVRTAGVGRSKEELQWDLENLLQLWEVINREFAVAPVNRLLYQESNIIVRALRDYLRPDITQILIDNEKVYDQAVAFMSLVMPSNLPKLRLYKESIPLFTRYQVEAQIDTAYQRNVQLPSGGELVIDYTEAMVAIDINSSKATKGGDIEETAYQTNLEAADEIARQMRLRDLGGLIVIDFIDMSVNKNRRDVEQRLLEATNLDRARVQIGKISRFGLLELSRQRLRPSLDQASHQVCPRCKGQGSIRGIQSLSLSLLRLIEEEAIKERTVRINAELPIPVATYLLNEKRQSLRQIEKCNNIEIVLVPNPNLHTPSYSLERISENQHNQPQYLSYQIPTRPIGEEEFKPADKLVAEKAAVSGFTVSSPLPKKTQKPLAAFFSKVVALFKEERQKDNPAVKADKALKSQKIEQQKIKKIENKPLQKSVESVEKSINKPIQNQREVIDKVDNKSAIEANSHLEREFYKGRPRDINAVRGMGKAILPKSLQEKSSNKEQLPDLISEQPVINRQEEMALGENKIANKDLSDETLKLSRSKSPALVEFLSDDYQETTKQAFEEIVEQVVENKDIIINENVVDDKKDLVVADNLQEDLSKNNKTEVNEIIAEKKPNKIKPAKNNKPSSIKSLPEKTVLNQSVLVAVSNKIAEQSLLFTSNQIGQMEINRFNKENNPLLSLPVFGQSVWYDNIDRELLNSGQLQKLISDDDLRGITSNPAIFQKALANGNWYDDDLQKLIINFPQITAREAFFALASQDIQLACDQFQSVYNKTGNTDGMVSLEVSPDLADDVEKTVLEAQKLHKNINRDNLMIKVPATLAGVDAVRELIALGINVNVTLLFSVKRYQMVLDAYIDGLKARVENGLPINKIRSVASFFVSRVDQKIDNALTKENADLQGRAAIANAQLAYLSYLERIKQSDWQELVEKGASVQRLLWASTATKDPDYSPVRYVEQLIGKDTVNTIPPATYQAFKNQGKPRLTLLNNIDKAGDVWQSIKNAGVDVEQITEVLEKEGIAQFEKSFVDLLDSLANKIALLKQQNSEKSEFTEKTDQQDDLNLDVLVKKVGRPRKAKKLENNDESINQSPELVVDDE